MVNLYSLDPSSTLQDQLQQAAGPIVVVSVFDVPPAAADAFLSLCSDDVDFMATQPGFVTARLHRGVGDGRLLYSVAEWESAQAVMAALASGDDPAKAERIAALGAEVRAYIHLFEKAPVSAARAESAPA